MFGSNNSFGGTSFGASTSFGSGFGATPSLGAFGAATQQRPQQTNVVGTTIKFQPVSGTDTIPKTSTGGGPTQVTTRHQNICAMKEYENKSSDELRLEDYLANRKVGQILPTPSFGQPTPFGQMQASTGFGASPFGATQPVTSQANTSIFGSSTTQQSPNLFSATPAQNPSTSIFGSPAAQPATNLFGANNNLNQSTSLFGQPKTGFDATNNSASMFGTPFNKPSGFGASPFGAPQPGTSQANTSIFGAPATQQSPNLFSATPGQNQTSSIFGTPATQPATNLFGANNNNLNQSPNLFGQPKTGFDAGNNSSSMFGSGFNKPTGFGASPFGAQQPATPSTNTSKFGAPATQQTPNLFSATPGQNQTSSIFGSPATQPATNLFGATNNNLNQSPNLFGQPKTGFDAGNNSSSMFGSGFNKPTGFGASPFGAQQPATPSTNTSKFGAPATQQTPNLFSATPAQNPSTSIFGSPANQPSTSLFNTNNNLNQSTSLFGQSKTGFDTGNNTSNLFGTSLNKPTGFGTNLFGASQPAATQANTSLFGAPTTQQSPNLFNATPSQNPSSSLFGSSASQPPPSLFGTNNNLNQSTSLFSQSKTGLDTGNNASNLFGSPFNKSATSMTSLFNISSPFATSPSHVSLSQYKMSAKTNVKLNKSIETTKTRPNSILFDGLDDNPSDDLRCAIDVFVSKKSIKKLDLKPTLEEINDSPVRSHSPPERNLKSCVMSTRPDYRLKPSIEEINRRYNSEDDTCIIDSLLIERPNYGSILFESPLDVNGLNIDEIVQIRRKEVVVYPDDENKPPVGYGLNRPATVTLHQVWPINKSTNEVIKDIGRLNLMKYPEKIESATIEKGARFVEYRPETGSWVFEVKHFSKYGIVDDDEEEVDENVSPTQQNRIQSPPKPTISFNLPSPEKSLSNGIVIPPTPQSPISHLNDSLRSALDDFFDEECDMDSSKVSKRSHKILGAKRLALPSITMERPSLAVHGKSLAFQQKVREILLKPDTFAAENKLIRDISSVCIAGTPKVRFSNGSRKFCCSTGDKIIVNELNLVPTSSNGTLADELKDRFETFLGNDSIVVSFDTSNTPYEFIFAPYIETKDFISSASSRDLLRALYGDDLRSKTPYAKQDERLKRVIDWLASVNQKIAPPENPYKLVVYHMSCDRYDRASAVLLETDHPRLALLVATLNLNKDLIYEQLCSWRLSMADQYIDTELLKIYILLAGLTEWRLSNEETVYCLAGLEWTQQLCLLAIHVTSFVTEPGKYGFHLLPLYMKRLDTDTNDVDYHILARHGPASILSAAESLVEEWFLLESLKSFHVINSESECLNSDVVHCNLAAQLGSLDIRWACFVALHIIENDVRKQVLIQCLERNQNQLKTTESWLKERLKIPEQFIERAKYLN